MPSWLPARAQVGAAMASYYSAINSYIRSVSNQNVLPSTLHLDDIFAVSDSEKASLFRLKAWPASLVHHVPTKLKYLAVTVMTAASTVLGKSVRFLEHVSPGCCACIASIVPVSWSA